MHFVAEGLGRASPQTPLARIIRETPARGVLVDEIGAKVLAALV
jgi:hypothetical protein